MNTVSNLDLMEIAQKVLANDNFKGKVESLDQEGINFKIKINDPVWNDSDFLDYRSAELILSIQDDFLNIVSKAASPIRYTREDLKKNSKLVTKVKVSSGCIQFETNIQPICSYLAELVNPQEQPHSQINVAGAFAALSVMQEGCKSWLETNNVENLVKELPNELKSKGEDSVDIARGILLTSRKTITKIANRLSSEGVVSISKEDEMHKAVDLKLLNKTSIQQTEIPYYIDAQYTFLGNRLNNQSVYIQIEKHSRLVSTENLDPTQKKQITDAVAKAFNADLKETEPFNLQITAIFKCGKLDKIKLVGLGAPREGSLPAKKVFDELTQKQTLARLKFPSREEQRSIFEIL